MHAIGEILTKSPNRATTDRDALAECIDACAACGISCTACADACDGEKGHVEMLRRCVRLNLDCAAICTATASVLSRQLSPDREVLRTLIEACSRACDACAVECERHASMHEHCRVCAEACRRCEEQLQRLAGLPPLEQNTAS